MTPNTVRAPLGYSGNGTRRPMHHDRQVLRASDLTLEQSAQDAMLARARRYLHGWGIVEGFVPQVSGKAVTVGPGYGVTPSGGELWLPAAALLEGVDTRIWACCGPSPDGCDDLEAAEVAASSAVVANTTVTAWLIARPATRLTEPRAGVPEDCAHPASALLASRRCGGVEFAILCELPPTHQPRDADCSKVTPFVCGAPGAGLQPLPWEPPVAADDDLLVIGRLVVADGTLVADPSGRRQLWPVSLIQEWIAGCGCSRPAEPVVRPPDEEIVVVRPPVREPVVRPPDEEIVVIRPETVELLNAPISNAAGVGPQRTAALEEISVRTEGEFLAADSARLGEAMRLSVGKVLDMKETLAAAHDLDLRFR